MNTARRTLHRRGVERDYAADGREWKNEKLAVVRRNQIVATVRAQVVACTRAADTSGVVVGHARNLRIKIRVGHNRVRADQTTRTRRAPPAIHRTAGVGSRVRAAHPAIAAEKG